MKRKIQAIGSLLVIATLAFSLAGCSLKSTDSSEMTGNASSTSRLDEIKSTGKIRIGVFSDKPPFGFVDSDGKSQGFDVYLAKRFAKDLLGDENKVEFVLVEAASRVEYLESGKVDIILANFTVTDERKEKVDFANPYMKVALGVASPDGSTITDVDQLKGKKLIVNKGTTAETFFTENYPQIELVKYDQNTEAFQALKDGRGDAIAHDNTLLFAWTRENKGFTTGIDSLGSLDTIAPAVAKDDTELLEWINEELTRLGRESFIHKAYEATLRDAFGAGIDPESVVVEGGKL